MGKFILFMSFVCLGLLVVVGSVAPGSPVMWLASTTHNYDVIRIVLMGVLLTLLVTNPPRDIKFRSIVGAAAITLIAWVLKGTYANQIQLVDSMAFLAAGISAGLTVLEQGFEEKPVLSKTKTRRNSTRNHARKVKAAKA